MTALTKPQYNIGAVAKLTGISAHTLRAWERRYAVVEATRADNGRRLYSEADVEKLVYLKALTDRGQAIGSIADLNAKKLRERMESDTSSQAVLDHLRDEEEITIGVLGDFLPAMMNQQMEQIGNASIIASDNSLGRFKADIKRLQPSALVLEIPVLDSGAARQIKNLKQMAEATQVLVIYRYGQTSEIFKLKKVAQLAKSPITPEVLLKLLGCKVFPASYKKPPAQVEESTKPEPIKRRRYSQAQLARLAQASTTVECECPKHIVDLVRDLSAFEVYSEQCENRDDKDAAMHHYLHSVSAQARHLMEVALTRVARAEGLLD